MATDSPSEDSTPAADGFVASDPLSSPFGSLNDLCYELSSLQELATRGSWRSILDKVSRARKLSLLQKPHEHLCYFSYNVLALIKLRRYGDVSEELASLEDLDHSIYQYESHPDVYPGRSGSMIPFALRWIHAEIPLKLGKRQETLDRLYTLLDFARTRWMRKGRGGWGFLRMCGRGGRQLLSGRCRDDPALVSKLGCIQLQIGDLEGAKASFELVEKMGKEERLVREYEECIERDGSDVVAINNKALCLMYLRDLSDSIKVLENALERVPTIALNETLVVNLCSMYELAYVNHSDIKRTLSNWIARVAPDDFDSSCTRI
ncbi:Trafficking protein particle complex subunit 12 [Vitis vinifera]|uniref:Trafficking protein particle complex subunit 12 n=1 Tax=Vitis vinifera TaxID=29760 RepID=A0A438KIQ5_VITVI|nr:Trafficking protein particle complex subunit 12 [Vitis vinifera]